MKIIGKLEEMEERVKGLEMAMRRVRERVEIIEEAALEERVRERLEEAAEEAKKSEG
jgi:hypothetical protein